MQLTSHSFPLLTSGDDGWISFRSYEALARVFVESITASAVVEVASGPDNTPTNLGAPSTLTFTQAGVVQGLAIPVGANVLNRVTRVRVISGQVSVGIVAPSQFSNYISAPVVTGFGI